MLRAGNQFKDLGIDGGPLNLEESIYPLLNSYLDTMEEVYNLTRSLDNLRETGLKITTKVILKNGMRS